MAGKGTASGASRTSFSASRTSKTRSADDVDLAARHVFQSLDHVGHVGGEIGVVEEELEDLPAAPEGDVAHLPLHQSTDDDGAHEVIGPPVEALPRDALVPARLVEHQIEGRGARLLARGHRRRAPARVLAGAGLVVEVGVPGPRGRRGAHEDAERGAQEDRGCAVTHDGVTIPSPS